jgi:GH24 family phage-related lysozyme (muramidase)
VLRWFAGVNLTQGMLDALTSLSMNVGSIPVVAPKLTADVREGNFADAAVQFLDIDRDENGRVLPGLERRRQAESTLFST